MKTLYLVRHGESQANADKVVAGGALDSPLTELGRSQAREAAKQVCGLYFDVFISSTMLRAVDTSEIIAAEIGWSRGIERDSRLIELRAGEATSSPIHDYHERLRRGDVIPGAETLGEMYDRVREFLAEIAKRPERSFLIVSHNGTGKMILSVIHDGIPNDFLTIPDQRNGEVVEVKLHEAA